MDQKLKQLKEIGIKIIIISNKICTSNLSSNSEHLTVISFCEMYISVRIESAF